MAPLAQFVVTFGARCFWVRVVLLVKITNGGFLLDRRTDVARRPARKLVNVPCEKMILQIYFPLCLRRASCIFFLAAAAALARSLGLSSVGGGVEEEDAGAIWQSSPPMPAFFAKVSGW